MNRYSKYFFFIAITGWILTLTVVILSFINYNLISNISEVWILPVGIFIVWLPAVLFLINEDKKDKEKDSSQSISDFYKLTFGRAPIWLIAIAIGSFIFTFVNFTIHSDSYSGSPDIENGQYVLQDKGRITKTLTEEDYHYHKAEEVRFFIGHGLAFYGIAAAILYPFGKKNRKSEKEDNYNKSEK